MNNRDTQGEYRLDIVSLMGEPAIRQLIRSSEKYYVYILCRPDGRPFYVGKGVDLRIFHHEAEAKNSKRLTHKLNLIRSLIRRGLSVAYTIDSFHKDEVSALERERHLISEIGRHDLKQGPLTNQTDGGEGTSNPSEESRQRRRETLWGDGGDDEDRAEANKWFQQICAVQSVPIKPLGKYKVEGVWRNRKSLSMKPRQAGALVASAIANRVMLEPNAIIPRRMRINHLEMIIENGVARDTLSSDMTVLYNDKEGYEKLKLTKEGHRFIMANIDQSMLLDAGVLLPEYQL